MTPTRHNTNTTITAITIGFSKLISFPLDASLVMTSVDVSADSNPVSSCLICLLVLACCRDERKKKLVKLYTYTVIQTSTLFPWMGDCVGNNDGFSVGDLVGAVLGDFVGVIDGVPVGESVMAVGAFEGWFVGAFVGELVVYERSGWNRVVV